jgi:glucose-1-phosphate thymidylyltransferase
MWGIIPAAGRGTRMQPLGFSKELLPLGSRMAGGAERPLAVSEYLLQRMLVGGAEKLCFIISPGKSDILEYFGGHYGSANVVYAVQPNPNGLCDAIFRASPLIASDEDVLIGLPDTIWFPETAYLDTPHCELGFILFPSAHPEFFDAVVLEDDERVREIQVKQERPDSSWVWGAIKLSARVFEELHQLWLRRNREDEYLGTLINAYLAQGGTARGFRVGTSYSDVGTPSGYRDAGEALKNLGTQQAQVSSPSERVVRSGMIERRDNAC